MPLAAGARLGPYEIFSPLGAGSRRYACRNFDFNEASIEDRSPLCST